MLLPVPFIPTPRRLLLAILLLLGTLVLIAGIVSRALILTTPTRTIKSSPASYLSWYTTESTLSIIFANLPFLMSLVVTAAPARIRHFSLAQWPRSRRGSLSWDDNAGSRPELRTMRFNSTATTIAELTVTHNLAKGMQESGSGNAGAESTSRPMSPDRIERCERRDSGNSILSSDSYLQLPSPSATRPETRDSQVPKMRLSGGLAEMGELSLQDTRQGWPIYWR